MESTGTSRNTTTVKQTVRISESGHLDRVRVNLRTIAEGLEDVRAKAREEIEAIDRLVGLVDAETLSGLITAIETLERRIGDVESEKEDLQRSALEAGEELDAEKARLTKLWDAYKAQEDELRRAQRDEPILREKLADREKLISELEDEVVRYKAMENYKERYQNLQREHERLRQTNKEIEEDLQRRNQIVADLESRMESMKSYEEDSRRVKELERQLSEEKERLAKLYKVYEDTEAKLREAEDEGARWRQWYDRHRAAFEQVGSAAHYPVKGSE